MNECRGGRGILGGVLVALAVVASGVAALAQSTDWPALIEAAKPAVVWILAKTSEGTAAGSGAIISPDGYILTAAHVVAGASEITIVVQESREFRASVVRSDAAMDVAVLKISTSGLTWLALGDSDQVTIEDEIRVLGYPLPDVGVGFIAVGGIIQGTRDRNGVTLLQHNASTAGGHSGGPVINADGQVIGVHSARLTDQPEYRVATSVNDAKRLIPPGALSAGPSPVRPSVAPVVIPPCPDCPSGMVLIPAGSFQMGDAFGEGGSDERPVRTVIVSAFAMDMFEVTKAVWDEVASWASSHGYDIGPGSASGAGPAHPVTDVSWYEAVKWANARSEKDGLAPCYTVGGIVYRTGQSAPNCNWSANGYRLPTEAEWEKAARGGAVGRRYPWGDDIDASRANYDGNNGGTTPVGSYPANGYGLYDMAGNVVEWCWDWYGSDLPGGVDPRGPASGSSRAIRGGSWNDFASFCRVANRGSHWPDDVYSPLGFRLVRTAP